MPACLPATSNHLLPSLLRFECVHVDGGDGFSKEFQSPQRSDLSPVVVFHKEGNALDALELAVLHQYIVGVFFQILAGQFDRHGWINVADVFESDIDPIDKDQDACI